MEDDRALEFPDPTDVLNGVVEGESIEREPVPTYPRRVHEPVATYASALPNPVPESMSPRAVHTPASLLREAIRLDKDIEQTKTYDFGNTRTPLDLDYGRYVYMKLLADPMEAAKMREGMRARIEASQRPVVDQEGVVHSPRWGLKQDDAALVGMTNDRDNIARIVAEKLLPTVPFEEAKRRVFWLSNGPAYLANDGRLYAAFPRFDYLDLDHGGLGAFVQTIGATGPRFLMNTAGKSAGMAIGAALGGPRGAATGGAIGEYTADNAAEGIFDLFGGSK